MSHDRPRFHWSFAALSLVAGLCGCAPSGVEHALAPSPTVPTGPTAAGSASTQQPAAPRDLPRIGVDFLNGVNLPWHNFSSDIGCGYEPDWFEAALGNIEAAGANAIRFWVHAGGLCSPTYDETGTPSGLPSTAIADLTDLLDRAANHGLAVIVTLWSHDMAKDSGLAFPVGHHDDIIRSSEKTEAYIATALEPIVRALDGHPGVLAWEVINEPELMVDGVGVDDEMALVSKAELQRFVGQIAAAIHRFGTKPVTVGSLRTEFLETAADSSSDGWWSDAALQTATGDSLAVIDLLQVHYYDYMERESPWDVNLPELLTAAEKPIIIGEFPLSIERGLTEAYRDAAALGYAGAFVWAYNDRCCGLWLDSRAELSELFGAPGTSAPGA